MTHKTTSPDISIIVTAHSEGILLHKTLQSIWRSIKQLERDTTYEIILHLDSPTTETTLYVERSTILEDVKIYKNTFGDPGMSRNFGIRHASGRYITLIDGDDLMSEKWLNKAYGTLENNPYGTHVAHSEMTVEFDGFSSIVQKYGEIDKQTDTLLSVWSGRWNSIIFAPSGLLNDVEYPSNSKGYGYEDWLLSCRLIWKDIHNITIPETVIFVRRKLTDSTWDIHRSSMAVLKANELLSFDNIRTITDSWLPQEAKQDDVRSLKSRVKHKLAGTRLENKSRQLYKIARSLRSVTAQESEIITSPSHKAPSWLIQEWKAIHSIEKKLFPTDELLAHTNIYHTITPEHYYVGEAYREVVSTTHHSQYDYLLFVPWLIEGGADLFAINYANTIATLRPDKKIAVIATVPNTQSDWASKLHEDIDFIPFGTITSQLRADCQNRVLEQFVENSHASHIHIFNSELGYTFINSHRSYIQGTDKKLIVTSFSQSTDETGRVFGYSHTHVPYVYDLANIITTDNQAIANIWLSEYGFDSAKIHVHRQPITSRTIKQRVSVPKPGAIRVLWSARLAPEKIPTIVPEVARLIASHGITIDMYGTPGDGFDTGFLHNLPDNLNYKGSFNDFYALNPQEYDMFLYTSLFDGMPNALLEASSVNLPIIASAVGGIPEFIEDEKGGVLINDVMNASEYANSIIALAKDPELRASLTDYSNKRIQKDFSISAHKSAIDSMLEQTDY